MRGLIWNDDVKARIRQQAAWAERPENWYDPQKGSWSPGDNPAYVLCLDVGFRTVYTHTVMPPLPGTEVVRHYRHLSISVDGPKYPHQVAAWSIATWYGFTGGRVVEDTTVEPGANWLMDVNRGEHCVVLVQEIQP